VFGTWIAVTGWYLTSVREDQPDSADRVLNGRVITFARPASEGFGRRGFLAIVRPGPTGELRVQIDDVAVVNDHAEVHQVDAESLAWLGLAGVGPETRQAVTPMLASVSDADSVTLRRFRDAAREQLPHVHIAVESPYGLFLDDLYRIDANHFYIRGWMRDALVRTVTLTAASPEGSRATITEGLVRFPRPDVEQFYGASAQEQVIRKPGFLGFFELPAPSFLKEGWIVEMRDGSGAGVEVHIPTLVDDPDTVRTALLGDLAHEVPPDDSVARGHVAPALLALQRQRPVPELSEPVQYGTPPAAPDVTIIVPLYRRIDFLEHQLASFVDDPDLRNADLVYVLDSPELTRELNAAATALHQLYEIPFRVVTVERNLGYAGANNLGADLARGRLLLLLNSDVLPSVPGWVSSLVKFHDRTPGLGAVGPKLVYEDESIQHAGMYFFRSAGSPLWENSHYFKGLHRSFPPANEPRIVPALTGACLLLSLDLWREVGGLSGTFIQGDYEDSDLCLRIAARGRDCWYLPDVELYHLEGQSYPTHLRQLTSRFNTWLHTHLWDEAITDAMRRTASSRLAIGDA
jgi:GT2 family glycosyltransferase